MTTIFMSKEHLLEHIVCGNVKIDDTIKLISGDKVEIYTIIPANEEDKEYQKCILKLEKSIDLIQK